MALIVIAATDQLMSALTSAGWAVVGGVITAVVAGALVRPAMSVCGAPAGRWPQRMSEIGLVLGAALAYSMTEFQCQATPVVLPDPFSQGLRILFHAVCLGLLLVITATDLVTLYIPDFVVHFGIVIGIVTATASGQLQMEHVWVDWNEVIKDLRGPYIPEWLKHSQHWHGLAWSSAGAVVGAGLTAVIRKVAAFALGRPAMGAGDVTLMAMVGAFLGWQATVIAFFIAPVLALALGPLARRVSAEKAVPYGPFLALGAIVVMFAWRWIWMFEFEIGTADPLGVDDRMTTFAVRRLFGDWVLLLGLTVVSISGTAGLMGLMRLFWTLPIDRERVAETEGRSGQPDAKQG